MEYSDVRHAVKSTFYRNTLCAIKLLVILEYQVSKISLSAGPRLAMGHQVSRDLILNLLGIAKGRSQWAMKM